MHSFKIATSVVKCFHLTKKSDWSNYSFAHYEQNMNGIDNSLQILSEKNLPFTKLRCEFLKKIFGIVRKHWKSQSLEWLCKIGPHKICGTWNNRLPRFSVGDKKLSTDFHTPLKTERLQKPGPKLYRQQNDRWSKNTEWPITTRLSEEVALGGGGIVLRGEPEHRYSCIIHQNGKWNRPPSKVDS